MLPSYTPLQPATNIIITRQGSELQLGAEVLICKCYPIYLATTNVFRVPSVLNPFTLFISIFCSATERGGNTWLAGIISQQKQKYWTDVGEANCKIARNSGDATHNSRVHSIAPLRALQKTALVRRTVAASTALKYLL